MHKTCTICNESKPIDLFLKKSSSFDGYRNQCKQCTNAQKKSNLTLEMRAIKNAKVREYKANNPELLREQRKAYRERNRARLIEKAAKYRAENKEAISESNKDRYRRNKERISAYFKARRHLKAEYDKAYVRENKERIAARGAEYKRNNPDKVRKHAHKRRARALDAKGVYSAGDVQKILGLQRGMCAYCRVKVGERYHVDHIKPLSRGGSNWPENLQILCPSCNVKKWAHDPIDFAQKQGLLL